MGVDYDRAMENYQCNGCTQIFSEPEVVADCHHCGTKNDPSSLIDIFAVVGQTVGPGTPMMFLGRTDQPSVIAYLDPKYSRYGLRDRKAKVTFTDGTVMNARVTEDAKLVKRLPAELSSHIGTRDLLLLVKLDFELMVPEVDRVDGLPVEVRFEVVW